MSLYVLVCISRRFSNYKEKTHNFCLCGWGAHTSIFFISLFSFLFFGFFPGREKGQILFTRNQTNEQKSIIYHPTVRWSLQRTMNSFPNASPRKNPAFTLSIKYRDFSLPPAPQPQPVSPQHRPQVLSAGREPLVSRAGHCMPTQQQCLGTMLEHARPSQGMRLIQRNSFQKSTDSLQCAQPPEICKHRPAFQYDHRHFQI